MKTLRIKILGKFNCFHYMEMEHKVRAPIRLHSLQFECHN